MERLTANQRRALAAIRDFARERGVSPTLDEIAAALGVAKGTVQQYLKALEAKGAIRRRRYAHRSIELLESGEAGGRLPLAGRIAAGEPIEAVEDAEEVDIAGLLGGSGRGRFVLQVKGDSMVEDGIFDGDYVVVEKRQTAEDGETVVALLPDGTATLKRIYRERGRVRLQPANAAMKPVYAKDVVVQGVVTGVIRKIG